MARKNKKEKPYTPKEKAKHPKKKEKKQLAVFEAVEAMSSSDEGSVERNNKAWNAKAGAVEELIMGGAYDDIVCQEKNKKDDGNDSIEEVVLGDDEGESNENDRRTGMTTSSRKKKTENLSSKNNPALSLEENSDDEREQDGSEEENDLGVEKERNNEEDDVLEEVKVNEPKESRSLFDLNSKALLTKTEELRAETKNLGWAEKFDVYPTIPLPFGTTDGQTGAKIDVHDDLKREVTFFGIAVEAVEIAKEKCKKTNVQFSRPGDFFAEMVKSDDHMARIKDRLIFETRKIEAVAQRKSNKEQKLRSKESQANKIAQKSQRKKDNIRSVHEWAQGAAASRGVNYKDNNDQEFLKNLSSGNKRPWTDSDGNLQTGPNKRRMAANKKYGFGGKRGRFKQNSPKSMNDMSDFNPRGNFGGLGTKKSAGSGGNRKGKRARDASRSRQQP